MTYEEQVDYYKRMIEITEQRIKERPVSSKFDQVFVDLVAAKNHYILKLHELTV